MTKDEIIAAAWELAGKHQPFLLGTVDAQRRPQLRWMGDLILEDPLTVWMACGLQSRKIAQLQANPAAQVLFQTEDFSSVATLSGRCEVLTDAESKQKVWDGIPAMARYISGPQDPNLAVLRFVPERVEVLRLPEGMAPQVAEL